MLTSALWDSIFDLKGKYPFMKVSLIDNFVPVLSFGSVKNVTLYLSGFSAEQWQGSIIALKFFEDMMKALKSKGCMNGVQLSRAFGDKGIALIPCVCPYESDSAKTGAQGSLPVARYCAKNKVRSIYIIKSDGSRIFAGKTSGELEERAVQIGKVLSACCKLPVVTERDKSDETRFCSWAGTVLGVPSFSLELGADKPSAIDRVYEEKKEMLLISALI